jgi:hypothetical protein
MHDMIINFMICTRWEQIKRYLKIFNLLENQKVDTKDVDWWKKLESMTFEFRKISKTHWLSENHISVNKQLMKFKKRSRHVMQIISKIAEVDFKLYSLCLQNYLYDFLFISKIWSQNVEILSLNDWFSAQRVKINELKSEDQLDFLARRWKMTSSFLLMIQCHEMWLLIILRVRKSCINDKTIAQIMIIREEFYSKNVMCSVIVGLDSDTFFQPDPIRRTKPKTQP